MVIRENSGKPFRALYIALLLAFLYLPIVVMIVLSFNASTSRAVWGGFTLQNYLDLLNNEEVIKALRVTLTIAVSATVISTALGTFGAIGMHSMSKGWANVLTNVSYLPMTTPDIVTGVSLMLMFVFLNVKRGWNTMLMAHIAFDTPYVVFAVLPRLRQMNPNTYEAALDLGCKPFAAIWKVIIPEAMPGILTGGLLAFTMSLDDFVISYFTTKTEQNLSILVFSSAHLGIKPYLYALSTLMFLAILGLLLIINRRSSLEEM